MAEANTPVWLITGCSTGFGRELAKAVLARGWRAVVTARDKAKVEDLAAGAKGEALPLALDVTEPSQIKDVVAAAKRAFGRIDVLVNNAGYGYQASAEEGDDREIRAMFDANVFGLFQMTQAVLPLMRQQRDGRILNISSVAGRMGFASSGFYAASKHAVEGWADALGKEVEPLGIKVINIEPGPFRTDWAGRSLKQTPTRIKDYEATVGARLTATSDYSGTQKGDPAKAAQLMIELAGMDKPPRQIVLGQWGVEAVTEDLRARLAELEAWAARGAATDFDEG
ncbi:KR domain-containing protein [Beijerinckiaceae bacterium RH AL1]|nr:oxidoreductase [Beijerinckiaceae bacterium]VVB48799.1 KR domain-containing protein [Beijerinckiaceae bacterium RH CH11]VVB48878.1 KR domain-containing protein [Beijerinckiaceae bacterium RH AL8]VVC56574.1 KR domain-containing protein [Beijerinckiaceae bacterium RH AL1]